MVIDTDKYRLKLESKPENVAKVEPLVERLRQELELSDDLYGNILVALTEAVNNAILHGNKGQPDKKTDLIVTGEKNLLSFIVKDEGPGFDYSNLPDPTAPENIEKPTGRGVFLMTQLSDMVIFSDNGSTVEIQFKL